MKFIIMLLFFIALLAGYSIYVHDKGDQATASSIKTLEKSGQNQAQNKKDPRLVDYSLVNQDGKEVKLYADLLKGRVVIMNFIFTTCNTICDLQGKRFSELQAKLGDRLENEINLISLTKDPQNDTPEKLKQWGIKHNLQKGWTLLTGEKAEIDKTFIAFTGQPPAVIEHSPAMLIGNPDKNNWIRVNGFEPVEEIEKIIEKVR